MTQFLQRLPLKLPACFLLLMMMILSKAAAGTEVSDRQYQLPVLKGKKNNPLLRIQLNVASAEGATQEFRISTAGTTRLQDLQDVNLYFCGQDSVFETAATKKQAILLGTGRISNNEILFKTSASLKAGKNYFWLTGTLSPETDLLHFVSLRLVHFRLGNQSLAVTRENAPLQQRVGLALRQHLDDNVHTYRIPGLTTTNKGTLLAVYDARRESARDLQGDIDIAVNRSTDGGNTWAPLQVAIDMKKWGGLPEKFNGVSDACILVDKKTNTIFLAGLWMHGVINEDGKWLEGLNEQSKDWNHQWRTKGSQPGFDVKQTSQFLVVKSTDDGKTWSTPVNLTKMCKKEDWWLWAPAPGHGITLQDGTLVFPTQGRNSSGEPFSNITYSKDGGNTWITSEPASAESTTECMAAELSDGSVMLNIRANKNRTNNSETNGRAVAVTKDLGKTWTEHPTSFNALPEPTCMASIHRHDYRQNGSKKMVLLFSNPDSRVARDHVTLKWSFDEGNSWPKPQRMLLDEGKGRGYSCITSVDENTIGIVYESSQADMVFQKISLKELLKH